MDTRITLHKLEVFSLVVELGGVNRAAEHLYVSQPVVSAHIRSLEERVGARLFYREGRHLMLTEAGRAVHGWANDVLTHTRELSRHLDALSDGTQGSVVVGASMSVGSYLLPPVVTRFRRQRPLVELQLNITDSDHAVEETEAGVSDFAVVFLEEEPANPGLEGRPLGREQFVIVGGVGHPPEADSITVEQLAGLPFIDSPHGWIRRRIMDQQLESVGISERNVVIELGHPEAMKRAAEAGLGVALLFRSAVRAEIETGRLREIVLSDATLSVPIQIVHRRDKLFSAIQRDLMTAIEEDLRRTLAA
jgi:LysR family transcriptional regulator, low CO2-responsive transcriptional regulator